MFIRILKKKRPAPTMGNWRSYIECVGTGKNGLIGAKDKPPIAIVQPFYDKNKPHWLHAINPSHAYTTFDRDKKVQRNLTDYINTEIAFRGDRRTPLEIEAANGFFSYRAWNRDTNHIAEGRFKETPSNRHDPDVHQAAPGTAMYISFTRNIRIAKGVFGNHYLYMARITGLDYNAFRSKTPRHDYFTIVDSNAQQSEVMAIDSVPFYDIIACRDLQTNEVYKNSKFEKGTMTDALLNWAMGKICG